MTSRYDEAAPRPANARVLSMLLLLLAASLATAGCHRAHAEVTAEEAGQAATASARKAVVVTTTPAAQRTFEERLTVQGNLSARTSSKVGPKIPGTLAEVPVREGDVVVAGETVLFRTDDAKLRKAVEANRLALAVAKSGIKEAQARGAQVAVELQKAERDYERFKTLRTTESVTEDALEQMEARYLGAKASRDHVRVLVQLAREQKEQAAVALAISEQDLADTAVLAPVNGVVTKRLQETGEMGAPGKPVVHIDDPSVVEISAWLPAHYYPRVSAGETKMGVRVYGEDLGPQVLSFKSPTIDTKTRTFEVRALVANDDGRVAPGAMAQIDITLSRTEGLGVPVSAVVERAGRSYVFVADGDTARMVPVEPGIESDSWVLVTGEGLSAGAPVVTLGQSMLDDGASIRIAQK